MPIKFHAPKVYETKQGIPMPELLERVSARYVLAEGGTSWLRVAPLGCGWHLLAAGGTSWPRMAPLDLHQFHRILISRDVKIIKKYVMSVCHVTSCVQSSALKLILQIPIFWNIWIYPTRFKVFRNKGFVQYSRNEKFFSFVAEVS